MKNLLKGFFTASVGNPQEKPSDNAQLGRIMDMGFSREMTEKLMCFRRERESSGKEGFDPNLKSDKDFLLFLRKMDFSDIGVAYRIYEKYLKNHPPLFFEEEKEKTKIQCIYHLYGAESIQDIISILKASWIQFIKSGDSVLLLTDIIKKLHSYLVVYGSLEHLEKRIGDDQGIVSRNRGEVQRILDNQKDGEDRIRRKQQLLKDHIFDWGKVFTRAFWIRWHVQRIFAKFDHDNHKEWNKEWRKELWL